MARCNATIHFNAPRERVFEVISDLRNAADRIDGIKSLEVLTDGEVGAGTRFRETRIVMKKEATEEMEVTSFDPPNGYAVECESCGALFHSEYRLTASPQGGTDLEFSMDTKALSLGAKLMSPLSGLMMGACKKALVKDMEDLRRVIEQEEGAPAGA